MTQFDQLEDIWVGDGIERGWGFQYKHVVLPIFWAKKSPTFSCKAGCVDWINIMELLFKSGAAQVLLFTFYFLLFTFYFLLFTF